MQCNHCLKTFIDPLNEWSTVCPTEELDGCTAMRCTSLEWKFSTSAQNIPVQIYFLSCKQFVTHYTFSILFLFPVFMELKKKSMTELLACVRLQAHNEMIKIWSILGNQFIKVLFFSLYQVSDGARSKASDLVQGLNVSITPEKESASVQRLQEHNQSNMRWGENFQKKSLNSTSSG